MKNNRRQSQSGTQEPETAGQEVSSSTETESASPVEAETPPVKPRKPRVTGKLAFLAKLQIFTKMLVDWEKVFVASPTIKTCLEAVGTSVDAAALAVLELPDDWKPAKKPRSVEVLDLKVGDVVRLKKSCRGPFEGLFSPAGLDHMVIEVTKAEAKYVKCKVGEEGSCIVKISNLELAS